MKAPENEGQRFARIMMMLTDELSAADGPQRVRLLGAIAHNTAHVLAGMVGREAARRVIESAELATATVGPALVLPAEPS